MTAGMHGRTTLPFAPTAATVTTHGLDATALSAICADRVSDAEFRIGHMGHVNPPSVLGALATIEAALGALGHTIQPSGIAAAARSLANPLRPHTPSRPSLTPAPDALPSSRD